MTEIEYETQSFDIVVQFPSIFEPSTSPFSQRPTYTVVFDHAELPEPIRWYIRAGASNRVRANSNYAPPLVEMSGQDHRLQLLLEKVASSRLTHRLLPGQIISVAVRPYLVRHPLARVPVALSLRSVGLYVTNLETHYERLMDELREELRNS